MSEKLDSFNSELEDAIAASQNRPAKPPAPVKRTRIKKRYVTTALVVAAVIAFLLWPREERIVIDNPVPYVFDRKFENSLAVFQKLEKHNELLIVHGARGIGKSRGIVTFGQQLVDDDRLFVHFDCTKLRSGASDAEVLSFVRNALMTGFRRLDGHDLRSGDKDALASISALVSVLGMNETRTTRHPIHNGFLREAADLISVILTKIPENPHLAISILFDVIDRLGVSLRPVVALSSPERLGSGIGGVINEELVDVFRKLSSDAKSTGFIIEISDEIMLLDLVERFTGVVDFRLIRVDEFDQEAARPKLSVNGMFKPHEQARLFEVFGGHGRYFCLVHEAMRRSKSFDDALEAVVAATGKSLNMTLFGPTNSAPAVDEKLELIRAVIAKPDLDVDLRNESVQFLVRHGIFKLSGTHASIADPAVLRWAGRLPLHK